MEFAKSEQLDLIFFYDILRQRYSPPYPMVVGSVIEIGRKHVLKRHREGRIYYEIEGSGSRKTTIVSSPDTQGKEPVSIDTLVQGISKHQCEIYRKNIYLIRDLDSHNGTYIKRGDDILSRVDAIPKPPSPLQNEQVIYLGQYPIQFYQFADQGALGLAVQNINKVLRDEMTKQGGEVGEVDPNLAHSLIELTYKLVSSADYRKGCAAKIRLSFHQKPEYNELWQKIKDPVKKLEE